MSSIFEVDNQGLRKLIRNRGLHRIIAELISNGFDEEVTKVCVNFFHEKGMTYRIQVEDDSKDGFLDLSHAYTLFAESYKKDDPNKRGRFNFGEKMAVVLCHESTISSTTGTVKFHNNTRTRSKVKRKIGSLFDGVIKCTKEEYENALVQLKRIIPPKGVLFTINDEVIQNPRLLAVVNSPLPTISVNNDGELIRTTRKTDIHMYYPRDGEDAYIFEMGIPVVKTGDAFHYDIQQKVPLSFSRDNVPPSFLNKVRTAALDTGHEVMSGDDLTQEWVLDAMSNASESTMKSVLDKRFGKNRATFDPTDIEANNRFASDGGSVIHGRTFSKAVWENIRSTEAMSPASAFCPTPSPFSSNPNAKVATLLAPSDKTDNMSRFGDYAKLMAKEICGVTLSITWYNDKDCKWTMCCGLSHELGVNVAALGAGWFDPPPATNWLVDDILLDEFGHFYESNHLCEKYYKALRRIGAKIGVLKLTKPELFKEFR